MSRNILQIPIKIELHQKAKIKASDLGFSSLQEMIRVILTQMTKENYRTEFDIDDLCEKYGIDYLGMFGSVARGEEKKDSDVDLLVKFGKDNKLGLFELDELQRELENRLGRRVDLVTKMNKHIKESATKDLKTIYEK